MMKRTAMRRRWRRHPFSLVEIMIVIVIIGMLAGLVAPAAMKRLEKAKNETADAQAKLLENACKDFYMDMSEYPGDLEDLIRNPGGDKWDGPYLDPAKLPRDPWGTPYEYDSQSHTVKSLGKDRVPSDDDRPVSSR
jgi:general secretion pathway protein G